MTLIPSFLTQRSGVREAGWKSEVRTLREAFNNLAITIAAMVPPGWVTTQGVYSAGSVSAKTWKNTAGVMSVKGVLTAIAAAETAFTHAGHDMAGTKEAWYVLLDTTGGNSKTIVKGADQTIGTVVLPAVGANLIPLCWLQLISGATGFDASTDDLTEDGAILTKIRFYPVTALNTINLV